MLNETPESKQSKFSEYVLRILFVLAILILTYLCYRSYILPFQFPEEYEPRLVVMMSVVCILFLGVIWQILMRVSERTAFIAGWVLIAAAGCIQLYIAEQMQLTPDVDLMYTIHQNVEMVETGTHYFTDTAYFSMCTNNIPLTILIYWVFRFAKLIGVQNYELAGGVFNVIMNMVTYSMGYSIARRLTSVRASVLLLLVIVMNPALYAYAAYYYTDTISMAFTAVAIYLFVCGCQQRGKKNQGGRLSMLWLVMSGFVLYLAGKIRVTSLFVLIAVIVYGVICRRWKVLLRSGVCILAGMLMASAVYAGLYCYHIDFDTKDTSLPWQHYLAMGVNTENTGGYSQGDNDDTVAAETHEEKVALNVDKWIRRIKENGLVGGWKLICEKEAVVWSYGSKHYYQYLQYVKDKNPIYDWIEGEHRIYFKSYMQAYNSLFLTGMLVSLAVALRRTKLNAMTCVAVIEWLGAVLFYVLWEAHSRQSVSYMLMMSMMLLPMIDGVTMHAHGGIAVEKER